MDKLDSIRRRQNGVSKKTSSSSGTRKRTVTTAKKTTENVTERSGKTSGTGRTGASGRTSKTTSKSTKSSGSSKLIRSDNLKRKKQYRRKKILLIFLRIVIIFVLLGIIAAAGVIIWATQGMDLNFDEQFSRSGMNLTSIVYYVDENGEEHEYERLVADQNRIWVDIENVPQNLKDAFVAIEDQRFYTHHGVDVKRTSGAVLTVLFKGDSSYGGSTITQQLVKNITKDNERSKARKIREMVRSVVLEAKMEKDDILELYMNTIYLGHGAHGVQAAARAYFDKDVSELSLVECAAIAGITQAPSSYDPITQPEINKKRRLQVLSKMYELGYITKDEYNKAKDEELQVVPEDATIQSYFVDYLYEELLNDLMNEGYSKEYATDLIYNGGLKIYSTVDPKIQTIMDDVYVNGNGLPKFNGESPQSAMVITDPYTGQIKGIAGGIGAKEGARVLNRASGTRRQPGSTMKPIAVYAPALDTGVITLASTIENTPLKIRNWEPKNASAGYFSESETVRKSIAQSYNIPAVRVMEELGVDTSYRYITDRLHLGIKKEDKDFAPLSLGGLSEGLTTIELTTSYAAFANGGEYIQPTSYTMVLDSEGNVLIDNTPESNRVYSEETAFLMTELLSEVVRSGTAAGYGLNGIQTCGKTGSSDNYKDRWFAGFTPYYSAAVWVGYDTPQKVSSEASNPATAIWYSVMKRVHENFAGKSFTQPKNVQKVFICSNSGQYGTVGCTGSTEYANINLTTEYCDGKHNNTIGTPGEMPKTKEELEREKAEEEAKKKAESGQTEDGFTDDEFVDEYDD